jgi:hypothetical protein
LELCGTPSFLDDLFHAVIGGGRLELVCLQADGFRRETWSPKLGRPYGAAIL